MNKFSEYLSIKIGSIVTAVGIPLFHTFELNLIPILVVLFGLSWALWLSVWRFVSDPQSKSTMKRKMSPFKEPHALFGIHVFATTITPYSAYWLVSTYFN